MEEKKERKWTENGRERDAQKRGTKGKKKKERWKRIEGKSRRQEKVENGR
jgi:hypothetical protein